MDLKEFFITPDSLSDQDLRKLEEKTPTNWHEADSEGQLAVDVYQTDKAVIITTAVAGVKPEELEISVNNDVVTIRGQRKFDERIKDEDYYYRECYWGRFSRSVVLPVEIKQDKIEAIFKNGILTVTLPKAKPEKAVKIKIADEE